MAVCERSSALLLKCSAGGLVIKAYAAGVEVEVKVVVGVTGAQSGFLCWHARHCPFPACLKNAQLHSPPAKNLAQSTQAGSALDMQPG